MKTNILYYGDNLRVLREHIEPESVDLIYLDPPFNSNRNYFVIFKDRSGKASEAQEAAFTDTWTWGQESDDLYRHLLNRSFRPELMVTIEALRRVLKETGMMAYLVNMAARLVEMHRVLKPTGSLYLHCDPTASHYLKLILDVIFEPENFRNEIIWKRTNVHNDSKTWSRVSDSIFFYTKTERFTWNPQYQAHSSEYVSGKYRYKEPDGRIYRLDNMVSPNPRPNLTYVWNGHAPPPNGWRYSKETMAKLDAEGRIWYPSDKSKRPQLKRYLSEMAGTVYGNVWTDIDPINSRAAERLGYPTQKPLSLLDRIISASSNEGDLVLDPFCGCGTAVVAAHKLHRKWIGVDVTAVAARIMQTRLEDSFNELKRKVPIIGFPTDLEGARTLFEIDPYAFQQWAVTEIGGTPLLKKGADRGIDGIMQVLDFDDSPHHAVIQVKGGKRISVKDMRDFCHVVTREKAALGFFLCLGDVTTPMRTEALSAGVWTSATGREYPRVQIIPVGDLLTGRAYPKLPPQEKRSLLGYKATRQQKKGEQRALFD